MLIGTYLYRGHKLHEKEGYLLLASAVVLIIPKWLLEKSLTLPEFLTDSAAETSLRLKVDTFDSTPDLDRACQ